MPMNKRLIAPLAAAAAAALAAASPIHGQDAAPAAAPAAPGDQIGLATDATDRMTVPVNLEGQGPYRFIVDTGAERTVISRELATSLQLVPGTTARVHSMTEVSDIATVLIQKLQLGRKSITAIHAPALSRRNLGAEGMLGVDTLQAQRVMFDFGKGEMTVSPSARVEVKWPRDTIVITARNRFGHLVLVNASVNGEKVYAVIDTGSQITIGNSVLRRKLEQKGKLAFVKPIEIVSVTGGRAPAELTRIGRIRIGDLDINDLPVAFADVHPFRKLELMDRPAILLGMDALQLFDRVSVDFANRKVRLLPPGSNETPDAIILPGSNRGKSIRIG
jgi:predicted aspartyl protease